MRDDLLSPSPRTDAAPSNFAMNTLRRRIDLVALLGLVLVWAIVYAPVLRFEFVTSDDWQLLVHNPTVAAWASQPLGARFFTPEFSYAIPVTVMSWATDFALGGGRPWVLHAGNAVWHIATVLVLHRVLRTMVSPSSAALAAGLFLVHPVQAEAVAFITQRKDLLAGFFSVLGLLAVRSAMPPRRAFAMALLCALAAAFAKPSGAVSGVALALAWALSRRAEGDRLPWPWLLALAALPLSVIGLDVLVDADGNARRLAPDPLSVRALRVIESAAFYAREVLAPSDPSPKTLLDPHPPLSTIVAGVAALLAPVGVLAMAWRRRSPTLALAMLWAVIAYAPNSNLQPLRRFVADSLFYGTFLGLSLAVGVALDARALTERSVARRALMVALGLALLAWTPTTRRYLSIWRDDDTLNLYAYRQHPDNLPAMRTLYNHLVNTGRPEAARRVEIEYLQRGVRTLPDRIDLRYQLFTVCADAGDLRCAQTTFEATPAALRATRPYQEMRLALAMRRNDRAEALDAARAIVRLAPGAGREDLVRSLEAAAPSPAPRPLPSP